MTLKEKKKQQGAAVLKQKGKRHKNKMQFKDLFYILIFIKNVKYGYILDGSKKVLLNLLGTLVNMYETVHILGRYTHILR